MNSKTAKVISKYAAYYRVSSPRQGKTGLGLDAQRHAVEAFLKGPPDYAFTEVESGRNNKRPELARALACCKATKSKLVIAKLDRLSRNATFLLTLRDSGTDFICVDMPQADRFTIGILALVAEKEAEMASQRTREALAQAKVRGTRLGNPRPAKSLARACQARQDASDAFAAKLQPVIAKAEAHGATTLQDKADALNRLGYQTPNGKAFFPQSVKNLVGRIASLA